MMMHGALAQSGLERQSAAPSLMVASANGSLIRFLQTLSIDSGWAFSAFLTGEQTLEAMAQKPSRLIVLDVFLDDKNGFDLRGDIRLKCENQLAPIMLVAPNCTSDAELAERLEISRARFEVVRIDEAGLAAEIAALMSDAPESELRREQFRYGTFLQTSGEVCHAVNQPLTSLICNLELAMHKLEDEALKQRLKISHDSALKIMRIIQRFQQSKRTEERDHTLPIYMLTRDTLG